MVNGSMTDFNGNPVDSETAEAVWNEAMDGVKNNLRNGTITPSWSMPKYGGTYIGAPSAHASGAVFSVHHGILGVKDKKGLQKEHR